MNEFSTFDNLEAMANSVIHGYGIVGQATAHAFGVDKYFDIKGSNITLKQASKLRYHFICLPTPVKGGRYFIDDIRALISQIVDYGGGQNVFIIRSTISPGTCRSLVASTGTEAIVHVPEFLSETTWKEDAENPDLIVVGCDRNNFREDVSGLFKARYKGVDIIETDTVTAETIKCLVNAFYATKVMFANEMYDLVAKRVGANWETIKEAMYKRKWIGRNHLAVWYKRKDWKEAKRGIHGACLSKDLEALAEFSGSRLLKLVKQLNEEYKGKKE